MSKASSPCVFCQIIAGELPASVIHRDEICWAFLDIRPVTRGHALVIPIQHAVQLAELDAETRTHLWQVGQRIAAAHRASAIPSRGHNFVLNDGKAANQTVAHAHLHIIPRAGGDLMRVLLNLARNLAGIGAARRSRLDADAEEIRHHLVQA